MYNDERFFSAIQPFVGKVATTSRWCPTYGNSPQFMAN